MHTPYGTEWEEIFILIFEIVVSLFDILIIYIDLIVRYFMTTVPQKVSFPPPFSLS